MKLKQFVIGSINALLVPSTISQLVPNCPQKQQLNDYECRIVSSCPCQRPELCLPISLNGNVARHREMFILSPFDTSDIWKYYDWKQVRYFLCWMLDDQLLIVKLCRLQQ